MSQFCTTSLARPYHPMVKTRVSTQETRLRVALGRNIRLSREEQGLSREMAAKLSGLHESQWQKLESGAVGCTLRTLALVAEALDVTPSDLLKPAKPDE